ncbi:hypothetical protein BU15DRAFT_71874 [Melanogaster broomeanus]|nr:hypothetical protein BU15DRAFT_71874 [Melanogaster broomeanus]
MALDTQGILSAVTIAIYVPVIFFAFRIAYKYGVRIVGGALLVAAELILPVVPGLYIGGYALEASGLSPLLLCTLGLLEMTTEGPDGERKYSLGFRILHLVGMAALALTIVGISTTSSQSASNTERRIGVLIFAALYIILVAGTVVQWMRRGRLMKYRKQLLLAISAALPFLAVRALYSVLSTFSSSTFITTTGTSTSSSDNALAKFNMFSGEWQIYLVMELLMEYAVVLIYTVAGTLLPLDQDYKLQQGDEYPLYTPQY